VRVRDGFVCLAIYERDEMSYSKYERLIGEVIKDIEVSCDQGALRLTLGGGIAILNTTGDCCSESWWADIDNVCHGKILSVEDIDLPAPTDNRTRQEVDEAYGVVFKTTDGTMTCVYRNSSNGYYGGSCGLSFENEPVLDQYARPLETGYAPTGWKKITDKEWSADSSTSASCEATP
jgi:hypothetical protein